jgi:hypothetical protein
VLKALKLVPRIKTQELLDRIANGDFNVIKLSGAQAGAFYMLLEGLDGSFIHENPDGSLKEYPNADYALNWLKRKTGLREIVVNIELWQTDRKG